MRLETHACMGVLALVRLLPNVRGDDSDAVNLDMDLLESQRQDPFQLGSLRETDISHLTLLDHEGQHSYTLRDTEVSSLSLHINYARLPMGCYFDISDGEGSQSERFDEDVDGLWGREIFGDTAKVVLQCPDEATYNEVQLSINSYAAFHPQKQGESLCGRMDREKARCYEGQPQYTTSRAVARARIGGLGSCTGWLVESATKNMLITNHHCIYSDDVAKESVFEFNYENPSCFSNAPPPNVKSFRGKRLVISQVELDFALIELEGTPGEEFGELRLAPRAPILNERIYVPQHPSGVPKEIGVKDTYNSEGYCRVLRTNANQLYYTCDTEPGSSGSPVLNVDNEAVGLHKEGGGCFGNGGVQVEKFRALIAPFLAGGGGNCPNGRYSENGACKECPKLWNCLENVCVGPDKADQRCNRCKNNFAVATNNVGGQWCQRQCLPGTYYRKNKCRQCADIPNCIAVTCTSQSKRDRKCAACAPNWIVSPNGRWCKRA